ncbi:MAG: galactose-1-phosphate uridylyltransferase [Candidatus Rifleibacteriota bacterium]
MYRQDPINKKWVIFAPHRARRPKNFSEPEQQTPEKENSGCPFCAGPDGPDRKVFQRSDRHGAWEQYVIANKYPAVFPELEPKRARDEWGKLAIEAFGLSEVIIETHEHYSPLHKREPEQIKKLFRIYQERMIEAFKDSRVTQVIIFKNSGPKAGASQPHPHSQLYALPVVPGYIRFETDCCRHYYDDEGTCPVCDIIEHESKSKKRVVLKNDRAIAICPFASENPYEVHIFPKHHFTSLTIISDEYLDALAEALFEVIRSMNKVLGEFDYNLVWDSAPKDDCDAPFFHLRLRVIPRLGTSAGLEIATQMSVNPVLPESAAEELKQALRKK